MRRVHCWVTDRVRELRNPAQVATRAVCGQVAQLGSKVVVSGDARAL